MVVYTCRLFQSPDGAKYDSLHPFVPSDLISFTQQIASGMVKCLHCIYIYICVCI